MAADIDSFAKFTRAHNPNRKGVIIINPFQPKIDKWPPPDTPIAPVRPALGFGPSRGTLTPTPPLCHPDDCPTCGGRGEIEAGLTGGFVCTGYVIDSNTGERRELGHPTWVRPNPTALDPQGNIWFTRPNPVLSLWGLAICQRCHGTGVRSVTSHPM